MKIALMLAATGIALIMAGFLVRPAEIRIVPTPQISPTFSSPAETAPSLLPSPTPKEKIVKVTPTPKSIPSSSPIFQTQNWESKQKQNTLPPPAKLASPPSDVRGIYFTSWSASIPSRIENAIRLIKNTELNAIVIDVKDFTGKVAFETQSPLIKKIGSEEIRIRDLAELIRRLHQENIYVVTRIVVFQDQHLAKVRPDLAVKDSRTGKAWQDRKGLSWVDPASKEVWDYNIEVAREAAKAGADELNFDYIRFPSDGRLDVLDYPFFNFVEKERRQVIREFFAYLREKLEDTGAKLSADIFGLATVNKDDLGIGQVLEDAFPYFDYVSPMVYPSHYEAGFLGYKNPAAYPYEVINYSLATAQSRRKKFIEVYATSTAEVVSDPKLKEKMKEVKRVAQIRPWLQAFNLGADYTPAMIRKEIQAVYDNGLAHGWYLWNPSNVYNPAALEKE